MDFVNRIITETVTNIEGNLNIEDEILKIEKEGGKDKEIFIVTENYKKTRDKFIKYLLSFPMMAPLIIIPILIISFFSRAVSNYYDAGMHFFFDQMTISAYLNVVIGILIYSAIISVSFWLYQSIVLSRDLKNPDLSSKFFKSIPLTLHFWRFYGVVYTMLYVVHHFSAHSG